MVQLDPRALTRDPQWEDLERKVAEYKMRRRGLTREAAGRALEAGGSALAGTPVSAREGISAADKAMRQVQLIEAMERLARIEQLRESEEWKYSREIQGHQAQLIRTISNNIDGLVKAQSQYGAAVDTQRLENAQTMLTEALESKKLDGWEMNTKRAELRGGELGTKAADYKQFGVTYVTSDGSWVRDLTTDPTLSGQFAQTLSLDLARINDDAERAFFIEEVERIIGGVDFSIYEMIARSVVPEGTAAGDPSRKLLSVARRDAAASQDIMERMKLNDIAYDASRRNYRTEMEAIGGSVQLNPELMNLMLGMVDEAWGAGVVPKGYMTAQRPPPMDADDVRKRQYVELQSNNDLTIDAEGYVVYTPEGKKKVITATANPSVGETRVRYEDFLEHQVTAEPTYAEKAKDYIDELWADLTTGEAKNIRELRAQIMGSEEFKAYMETRFGGAQVDASVAFKIMMREARARRSMQKKGARQIGRAAILGGQAVATPGQYRRAALGALFAGQPGGRGRGGRLAIPVIGKFGKGDRPPSAGEGVAAGGEGTEAEPTEQNQQAIQSLRGTVAVVQSAIDRGDISSEEGANVIEAVETELETLGTTVEPKPEVLPRADPSLPTRRLGAEDVNAWADPDNEEGKTAYDYELDPETGEIRVFETKNGRRKARKTIKPGDAGYEDIIASQPEPAKEPYVEKPGERALGDVILEERDPTEEEKEAKAKSEAVRAQLRVGPAPGELEALEERGGRPGRRLARRYGRRQAAIAEEVPGGAEEPTWAGIESTAEAREALQRALQRKEVQRFGGEKKDISLPVLRKTVEIPRRTKEEKLLRRARKRAYGTKEPIYGEWEGVE